VNALLAAASILLAAAGANLLARLPGATTLLANADTAYLPVLFGDLAAGGALADWALTPGPYVFPDMLVYAVAWLVAPGWEAAFAICAVLQVAILLGLAILLGRIAGVGAWRTLASVPMLMAAFIAAGTLVSGTGAAEIWAYPILPTYHLGAALMALAGFALVLGGRIGTLRLVLLALLTAATTFSDSFMLLFFVGPAVAMLLLDRRGPGRERVAAIVVVAGSGLLVLLGQGWINPLGPLYRDQLALGPGHGFWRLGQILDTPGGAAGLAVAILGWLPAAFAGTRAVVEGRRTALDRLAVMILAGGLLTLVFPVLTGMVRNLGSTRYLMPVTLFGPLWLGLRLGLAAGRPAALGAGAVVALVGAAGLLVGLPALPAPAALACGIRGPVLTDYWNAKSLRLFSDGAVAAIPITPEGDRYWWMDSRAVWRGAAPGAILTERLDSATILTTYGRPDRVVPCGTGELWYYDDPDRLGAILASRPEAILP
jgi:hypothetical protein